MHPFVIDQAGSLFVDLGSATNACQKENRIPGSHGVAPCVEKETRAGTWRFDANKTDQVFSPTSRYASGIRNGEGFAFDAEGRLFVMHMAVTNCSRTGRGSIPPSRARNCQPRNCCCSWRAPIMDGRNAIMTNSRASSYWRRNMAATAARQLANARGELLRSRHSRALGAKRSCDLSGDQASPWLPRRSVRRLSWILESRSHASAGLQRRFPAARAR